MSLASSRDRPAASKLSRAGGAGERDDVADVAQPRGELDRPLETEPEARVWHGAVAPKVQIPPVVAGVEAAFGHAALEDLAALLALAPADDLAHLRHLGVHRGHRPLVVVQPHVERLDTLRVVPDDVHAALLRGRGITDQQAEGAPALEAAFAEEHPGVEVHHVETLALTNAAFRKSYTGMYEELVRHLPSVWGMIYERMERRAVDSTMKRLGALVDRLNARPLLKQVEAFAPDRIVCTHYLPAEPCRSIR